MLARPGAATAEQCSYEALAAALARRSRRVRRAGAWRSASTGAALGRAAALIGCPGPARGEVAVFYGHRRIPAPGRARRGRDGEVPAPAGRLPQPAARLQPPLPRLELAAGATRRPLIALAQRRGAPIVVNQDGVAYPAWAGRRRSGSTTAFGRARRGRPRRLPERVLQGGGRPLPRRAARGWEVLHNAVDTSGSRPPASRRQGPRAPARRRPVADLPARAPRCATLAACPDARLLVTGSLVEGGEELIERARSADRVELAGRYAQRDAPAALPARARAPPPEGERPVPQRRARGARLRRAGRPLGERRHAGAGRATPASASARRRRGSRTFRPRRRRWPPPCEHVLGELDGYPRAGAGARASSASTSHRGWSATARCSRSWSVTVARVSVVMPVRDGERFLREALESMLAQTSPSSS